MGKLVKPQFKSPKPRYFFREWRKFRGLTQEELAGRMDVSTATISQLETGKQGWTDTTLLGLADALGCEPADLLIRNPLNKDAPWSLWDRVSKAPPEKRDSIIAVIETMLKMAS